MKTSVELDNDKVALARRLGGTATLKQLLHDALDAYIAQARRGAMADMLGTDFFKGNLSAMRERRRVRPRR